MALHRAYMIHAQMLLFDHIEHVNSTFDLEGSSTRNLYSRLRLEDDSGPNYQPFEARKIRDG